MSASDIYETWRAAPFILPTKHGKEHIIAPLLRDVLGVDVVVPNFDTDTFGTFAGDVPRPGNQLETLRAKLTAALEELNEPRGLASEGSFTPHRELPFLNENRELVLFIDRQFGIEVLGEYVSNRVMAARERVQSAAEAVAVAERWGFPAQGVILRRHERDCKTILKDANDTTELEAQVHELLRSPFTRSISIETDQRAHRNPTRRHAIEAASQDLIDRLASPCPACDTPGFGRAQAVPGLPCALCTRPTSTPKAFVQQCPRCAHEETKTVGAEGADPGSCEFCNP